MQKRKTAIDLTDLAIGILILGITVSIGTRILIAQRDNRLTELDTFVTANESLTTVTEAGENLANRWVVSIDSCLNQTDNVVIGTANYTTSINPLNGVGTVTGAVTSNYNNTNWNCTYTSYNISRPDWALPDAAATGIAEFGNWFDIIVIVGIAGVILSLIFLAFGRKGDEGAGVSY